MWRKLDLLVRSLDVYINYRGKGKIMLNNGNISSDIMLILTDIKDDALLSKNILNSPEGQKIKDIFNFVGIPIDDIYITSLYKLDRRFLSVDKKSLENLLDALRSEIFLVNPKYIITVGGEVFNLLISDIAKMDITTNNVNFYNSVGKMYDYEGRALVPIYDFSYILKSTKEEKKKMVDVLEVINKIRRNK